MPYNEGMYDNAKAAELAAYLLFKAGADGLAPRRLLALLYLAEREEIKRHGLLLTGDEFMLTEDGPVMKRTHELATGSSEEASGEWTLRIEERSAVPEPAMVAEGDAAYANRTAHAHRRLVLRNPQPPPRWPDNSTPLGREPHVWLGKDEGLPYFQTFSRHIHELMNTIWGRHGERGEEDLIRHMRELPECRTQKGAGRRNLTFSRILQAVGHTEREIKDHLEFANETDQIQRFNASPACG